MTYDSFVTAAIAREAQAVVGAYVDHIAQPAERELCVTFYAGRGKARWLFSADARLARVHQIDTRPENPSTPPNFCMVVRKWIDGARLTGVRQVGFDRVLHWEFSRSDGCRTLVAEIMGKHANLLLLDEGETILGVIKPVPASISRARQVLPGLPYVPPPGDRLDPLTADRDAFVAAMENLRSGPDAGVDLQPGDLVRALTGFGPFAAAEALARAGSGDLEAVWNGISRLAAAVREGRFEPTVFFGPVSPSGFWAFASVQVPAEEQARAETMSAAAERYFSAVVRAGSEGTLRKELLTVVRKERERLERLAARLEEDLRRGEDVERWKIAGELLAANLWQVARGQKSVEVPNYYDPEQRPLTIELDPELTPQENVERQFRRYRKGTDAALQAMGQLETVATRLQAAREWEAKVQQATLEELPGLKEAVQAAGIGSPAVPGRSSSEARRPVSEYPPGVRIRRYAVEGWEVLVGENATSNDYLTTRVARPDDWWLHVRAATSAHVVIRTGGRPDRVPPTVLREAARLTAAHSESKHSSYVPVDYVLKRYVRKPRGSAPGLVTHRGEKTLYVEPAGAPSG